MTEAERLGAELVMLMRRQYEQERELERTKHRIDDRVSRIRNLPSDQLYTNTSEIPVVTNERVAGWINERQRLLPTITRTPATEALTERLPAVLTCPRTVGGHCPELHAHIHTADGIQALRDL